MKDSRQSALVRAANKITLRSDLPHMVEKLNGAYGMSWKSRRIGWMRNGEDVML